MKTSRICRHIEKYMDVLSVVEKTKAERGTYLKVPMRYEIWSILDSMMLAFGLYTEEELSQKYPKAGRRAFESRRGRQKRIAILQDSNPFFTASKAITFRI